MSTQKQVANEIVNFFEKRNNLDETRKNMVARYFEELGAFFTFGQSKFFCYDNNMHGEQILRVPRLTLEDTEFENLERVKITGTVFLVPEAMPDLTILHEHLLFHKNLKVDTLEYLKAYLFSNLDLTEDEETEAELSTLKYENGSWFTKTKEASGLISYLILTIKHEQGTYVVSPNLELLKAMIHKKIKTPKETLLTANFWEDF